jgi:serine/threonine-protein kinase HipA
MVTQAVGVEYRGQSVGAVSFDTDRGVGAFEYDTSFLNSGIELSPLMMPLKKGVYQFPSLNFETYKGLPGLVADSLPDDFGDAILNAWAASAGRQPREISPLERLQFTGIRGMGALEYHPVQSFRGLNTSQQIHVDELVSVAQDVLNQRSDFSVNLPNDGTADPQAMMALLSVGTSAGGARPKAVLAFDEKFTEVRSGQTDVPEGFDHYLLKFDGVSEHNKHKETFGDPMGFGAMEYVYYRMARLCKIDMTYCNLLKEGNRRHLLRPILPTSPQHH